MIIYEWVKEEPVTVAAKECCVDLQTAVDWYNFCREIAEVIMSNDQKQIGGKNLCVEIDETFTRRRKYNRGRITKGTEPTIFGAYCRETREMMYFHVENKSRRVLWSHMSRYITPGSIIVSDSALQYCTVGWASRNTRPLITASRAPGDSSTAMIPRLILKTSSVDIAAEEVHQVASHEQEPAELHTHLRIQDAVPVPVANNIDKIPAVRRTYCGRLPGPRREGL
ncbi:uncharacterized protein LOC111632293 [Centruroides sculpturatus]|uniref:uncharacterized protein LOC111632293 n=1 Tax=Centruroides sculpturatus TaxID=218467 RepID=UPI000C6D210B|nr:uncharacterized protein LOC111632293 [Centruroides sculpturatus]XP_023232456.1 uncharacterized protein LOC111632293 [Centruroides sculpturatus]